MSCSTAPGAALQFQNRCCALNPLEGVSAEERKNIEKDGLQGDGAGAGGAGGSAAARAKGKAEAAAEGGTSVLDALEADDEEQQEEVEDLGGFLRMHYGDVAKDEARNVYRFAINDHEVTVAAHAHRAAGGGAPVACEDERIRAQVERVVRMATTALERAPVSRAR
mmetsp:Transcript_5332/g.9551  ORF Transcript_5332/g.9551 Transcript_5332/m.9551 type:complete len:166 (+) Transcript_5332:1-498(+)